MYLNSWGLPIVLEKSHVGLVEFPVDIFRLVLFGFVGKVERVNGYKTRFSMMALGIERSLVFEVSVELKR